MPLTIKFQHEQQLRQERLRRVVETRAHEMRLGRVLATSVHHLHKQHKSVEREQSRKIALAQYDAAISATESELLATVQELESRFVEDVAASEAAVQNEIRRQALLNAHRKRAAQRAAKVAAAEAAKVAEARTAAEEHAVRRSRVALAERERAQAAAIEGRLRASVPREEAPPPMPSHRRSSESAERPSQGGKEAVIPGVQRGKGPVSFALAPALPQGAVFHDAEHTLSLYDVSLLTVSELQEPLDVDEGSHLRPAPEKLTDDATGVDLSDSDASDAPSVSPEAPSIASPPCARSPSVASSPELSRGWAEPPAAGCDSRPASASVASLLAQIVASSRRGGKVRLQNQKPYHPEAFTDEAVAAKPESEGSPKDPPHSGAFAVASLLKALSRGTDKPVDAVHTSHSSLLTITGGSSDTAVPADVEGLLHLGGGVCAAEDVEDTAVPTDVEGLLHLGGGVCALDRVDTVAADSNLSSNSGNVVLSPCGCAVVDSVASFLLQQSLCLSDSNDNSSLTEGASPTPPAKYRAGSCNTEREYSHRLTYSLVRPFGDVGRFSADASATSSGPNTVLPSPRRVVAGSPSPLDVFGSRSSREAIDDFMERVRSFECTCDPGVEPDCVAGSKRPRSLTRTICPRHVVALTACNRESEESVVDILEKSLFSPPRCAAPSDRPVVRPRSATPTPRSATPQVSSTNTETASAFVDATPQCSSGYTPAAETSLCTTDDRVDLGSLVGRRLLDDFEETTVLEDSPQHFGNKQALLEASRTAYVVSCAPDGHTGNSVSAISCSFAVSSSSEASEHDVESVDDLLEVSEASEVAQEEEDLPGLETHAGVEPLDRDVLLKKRLDAIMSGIQAVFDELNVADECDVDVDTADAHNSNTASTIESTPIVSRVSRSPESPASVAVRSAESPASVGVVPFVLRVSQSPNSSTSVGVIDSLDSSLELEPLERSSLVAPSTAPRTYINLPGDVQSPSVLVDGVDPAQSTSPPIWSPSIEAAPPMKTAVSPLSSVPTARELRQRWIQRLGSP